MKKWWMCSNLLPTRSTHGSWRKIGGRRLRIFVNVEMCYIKNAAKSLPRAINWANGNLISWWQSNKYWLESLFSGKSFVLWFVLSKTNSRIQENFSRRGFVNQSHPLVVSNIVLARMLYLNCNKAFRHGIIVIGATFKLTWFLWMSSDNVTLDQHSKN